MALWGGIDEAGYGPRLGPLVVAGTLFRTTDRPHEGMLWERLRDAVARDRKTADGRLIVDDSKRVYSRAKGIRTLEEGVLSFLALTGTSPPKAATLLDHLFCDDGRLHDGTPWSCTVGELSLPRAATAPALASKAEELRKALLAAETIFLNARAGLVLPMEFNRILAQTRTKGAILFHRCGRLLRAMWLAAAGEDIYVLVDRHGGRLRYRRHLTDTFPGCAVDILREGKEGGSVYRISDGAQAMVVAFKEQADSRALPVALASMTAKYVRELYMEAFNAYWVTRLPGLKPTAGYAKDAQRFLAEIETTLKQDGTDAAMLVRAG